MPKITDISILGGYKNKEDQVTSAFLHLLDLGGEKLLQNLLSYKGSSLPTPILNITCQYTKGNGSRPDGAIDNSFKILFESKISKNAVKKGNKQLCNHLNNLPQAPNNYLIYITPDSKQPSALNVARIIWFNWVEICDIFNLFAIQSTDLFKYLCAEFEKLLENFNIIDNNIADRVLIVGGRIGERIADQYGIYLYQPTRTFLQSSYIAFYTNKRIQYVYVIKKELQAQDLSTCNDIPAKYLFIEEPHYQSTDLRNVFILKPYKKNLNIMCNNKTHNNKNCAFIQSHTYTTINKILKAQSTSQL